MNFFNSTFQNRLSCGNPRNLGLDLLKVCACIGVIALHSLRYSNPEVPYNWVIYYAMRACIPVFFMINGFLLLNKAEMNWKYAVKKMRNVGIVIVGWITFITLLKIPLGGNFYLPDYYSWIWQRGNFSVFWFFAALLIMYAILPLLHRIFKFATFRWSLIGLLFAVCAAIDLASLREILNGETFLQKSVPQCLRLWTWIFYYMVGGEIGHLYMNGKISEKLAKAVKIALIPLTIAAIAYQYWCCKILTHEINSEFLYDNPVLIIWTIAIMIYFLSLKYKTYNKLAIKAVEEISLCGLGIYAFHIVFIRQITAKPALNALFDSFFGNYLLIIFIFAASFFIAYSVRRIPYLKIISKI